MSKELILIKNKYGEEMMHFARENFSTILEQEGLLFELLSNHFDYSKNLLSDIKKQNKEEQFINYIYSLSSDEYENSESVNKTPEELLSDAGYILYECKTEEDIQRFKKYYANGEKLCTFNGGRLNRCHVFFAVKKDVNSIKRKDFKEPERQDLYGTSVISIQFSRGETNILSIKNRYNHIVSNPDATFSNNLENIIPGLTKAFENKYNLNIKYNKGNLELLNYVMARDGKYYKYNYEINNIYYCTNNVIIDDFNVKKFDKSKYLVIDYFVFDLQNKKIYLYDKSLFDSFPDSLKDIKKVEVRKEEKIKKIIINNEIIVGLDDENNILSYKNSVIEKIGENFLYRNKRLQSIELPNLNSAGNNFLTYSFKLESLNLPKLTFIGKNCLKYNLVLYELNLPNLTHVGDNFLEYNNSLVNLYLPNLKYAGSSFLWYDSALLYVDLPNLLIIGDCSLTNCKDIESINLPKLDKRDYKKIIKRISYLKGFPFGETQKDDEDYNSTFSQKIKRLLRR